MNPCLCLCLWLWWSKEERNGEEALVQVDSADDRLTLLNGSTHWWWCLKLYFLCFPCFLGLFVLCSLSILHFPPPKLLLVRPCTDRTIVSVSFTKVKWEILNIPQHLSMKIQDSTDKTINSLEYWCKCSSRWRWRSTVDSEGEWKGYHRWGQLTSGMTSVSFVPPMSDPQPIHQTIDGMTIETEENPRRRNQTNDCCCVVVMSDTQKATNFSVKVFVSVSDTSFYFFFLFFSSSRAAFLSSLLSPSFVSPLSLSLSLSIVSFCLYTLHLPSFHLSLSLIPPTPFLSFLSSPRLIPSFPPHSLSLSFLLFLPLTSPQPFLFPTLELWRSFHTVQKPYFFFPLHTLPRLLSFFLLCYSGFFKFLLYLFHLIQEWLKTLASSSRYGSYLEQQQQQKLFHLLEHDLN